MRVQNATSLFMTSDCLEVFPTLQEDPSTSCEEAEEIRLKVSHSPCLQGRKSPVFITDRQNNKTKKPFKLLLLSLTEIESHFIRDNTCIYSVPDAFPYIECFLKETGVRQLGQGHKFGSHASSPGVMIFLAIRVSVDAYP